jgi:dynein heavy chain
MRMYPALVNCTTIDLFNEWPPEALLEVGERYLRDVDLEGNEQVNFVFNFFLKNSNNEYLSSKHLN